MKSQRRHELKENVLAHELGQIRRFFSKYGHWITGALTALAVVVAILLFYRGRSARKFAEEKNRFQTLTSEVSVSLDELRTWPLKSPKELRSWAEQVNTKLDEQLDGLADLAENASDPFLAASAALWVADTCSKRLLYAPPGPTRDSQSLRRRAERYYRLVVTRYPAQKVLVARAHMGLGVLAENAGDMDLARTEYDQAAKQVSSAHTLAIQARWRIQNLPRWFEPVKFATTLPATQPATSPATQPATQPATSPVASRPASASTPTAPGSAPASAPGTGAR